MQLNRHRFEEQHGSKTKLRFCFCGFRFGAGDNLKMIVADGRRGRQYMPILRQNNPSSSRWSENLHSVRESKSDNLFTYLLSREDGASDGLVHVHIMPAWGITACITYRCFGSNCEFMHDHDDSQRLSHGACIADIHIRSQREPGRLWAGFTCITSEPTYIFMQTISENISLSYRSDFEVPETVQDVLSKKPRGVKRAHGA